MIKRLKSKSEFSRNVLTLMTGTTIAQALPIAAAPILTRIYTPEDFGIFALFVSVLTIIGSIANGRYELAIMLPKDEEEAINIFALSFIITLFVSFFCLIIVLLFNAEIAEMLGEERIRGWLYLLPAAILLTGFFNILNYYNNRIKKYQDIRNAAIYRSFVLAGFQLGLGVFKNGPLGLIVGQVISLFSANYKLSKNILNNKKLINKIDKKQMIGVAKKFKSFPLFSIPAILANTLTFQLINILITTSFSVATLGFYSLMNRVIGIPASLIGGAISQVFFQQASTEKQNTGKSINTFKTTAKKLVMLGAPIFLIAYFLVEEAFAFVFGEDWRIAGKYAKIITPLFFIRFVVATLSPIDTVMEKQNFYLGFNVLLLGASLFVFYYFKGLGFEAFLYAYTILLSVVYVLYGMVLFFMANARF